jgi:AmmeMemoRadiSam system protein A
MISIEGRKELLRIARESISLAFERKPSPRHEGLAEELTRPAGVFVTLKKGDRLQGCIGVFEARKPVWEHVAEYARNAAFEDRRFNRLQKSELDEVWIEISVLSELKLMENPLDIEIGKHGIWIVGANGRRGTYLPQVATEYNMSKEQFLSDCCSRKAGLAPDAWRDPKKAKVYVYTAEVFSERNIEGGDH